MTFEELLGRLPGPTRRRGPFNAETRCPAHEDHSPSLSCGVGAEGHLLLHCFAGCAPESILGAIGLTFADLMPDNGWQAPPPTEKREVAWYDYRDADGSFLYQVVRFEPKDFRPRRQEGGEWVWNLQGVKRVPYRLPELLATPLERPVFIVEGEKDVETIRRFGHTATTKAGGVDGTWEPGWNGYFSGRRVILLPDNDEPGRRFVRETADRLGTLPRLTRIWELKDLPPKGDVSDYVLLSRSKDPIGDVIEAVEAETQEWDEYWEEKEQTRPHLFSPLDYGRRPGRKEQEGLLDSAIFCPGNVGCIYGPGGVYKTYFSMFMAGQMWLSGSLFGLPIKPARTIFFSEEMSIEEMDARCESLWTSEEKREIDTNLLFAHECDFDFYGTPQKSEDVMAELIREAKAQFWIMDALYLVHTGNPNSNQDLGKVIRSLRRVARVTKTTGLVIHHQGKGDPEAPRKGADKMLGASVLKNWFSDILNVTPRSRKDGRLRSLIVFDKTRHQKPPDPFGLTAEMVPGAFFSFDRATEADLKAVGASEVEVEGNVAEADAEKLAEWMVSNISSQGKIRGPELFERFRSASGLSKNRVERAILQARESGKIQGEVESTPDKKGRPAWVYSPVLSYGD